MHVLTGRPVILDIQDIDAEGEALRIGRDWCRGNGPYRRRPARISLLSSMMSSAIRTSYTDFT